MSKTDRFKPSTRALGQMIYSQPKPLMIGQVIADSQIQIREEGLDQEVVYSYTEKMLNGIVFPPIDVFEIPQLKIGRYYVADGFHRLAAAIEAKWQTISANVHQGTLEEAQAFAAEANLKHGKHLSNGDKKRCFMLLRAEGQTWENKSLRSIAVELAVVPTTVSNWENERLSKIGQPKPNTVLGQDGRVINVSGIREAAKGRPQSQMLDYTGDDDDLSPAPDEDWQEEREQLQAALEQLNAEREQAYKAWQAAKTVEEGLGQSLEEVNRARHKRVQAEADYNRLAGQMEGLQERINAAIAIKQQIPPKPTKADGQLKMKLAFAVQKGWVDPDQAELHTWEDLDPFNATRFRLKNLVTNEIVDPHSRPVERVEQAIKAVQTAEDKLNGVKEQLMWKAQNGQRLSLTWLPKSGFKFFMTTGLTSISVVLDYAQAEELANALISRIEDYDSRL